ncbi:MAG: sodium:calcium antiporter, partial [Nanoarchaeota archaeon]|nr:sodium:calcium antiporter [Nanoarchaeota archaeon]
IYLAYVLFLFGTRKKYTAYNFTDFVYYYMKFEYFTSFFNNSGLTNGKKKVVRAGKILVQVGTIILSCAAIIFSADLVVDKAVTLATLLKVNERIIGLTVIAIGTSLPELSVTILAATKGYSTIAVGNIVGSNIANILLVLGISASLKAVTIDQTSLQILIPLLIATSSFFVLSISKHGRLEKREGLIFIGLYGIFLIASLLF